MGPTWLVLATCALVAATGAAAASPYFDEGGESGFSGGREICDGLAIFCSKIVSDAMLVLSSQNGRL